MYSLPIEQGKVQEFARAIHSEHPAYAGAQATIPPTFLFTAMTLWEPQGEPSIFDFGFARFLHGEEEYIFHSSPPRAGTTLQVTARLGDQWDKVSQSGAVMRFGTVIHEFRDESGVLVVEQHSTIVETDSAPEVTSA